MENERKKYYNHKKNFKKGKYSNKSKKYDAGENIIDLSREFNADGWYNEIAGIGGSQDKRKHTYFKNFIYLDDEELGRMYIGDGLGSKIIDAVAEDSVKEGYKLEGDTDDHVVRKKLSELCWEKNFSNALKWQRLYGGSVLFIGVMDGRPPDQPVNFDNIQSIEFIKPVDRTDINITTSIFYEDPTNPKFGQVEKYDVNLMKGVNMFNYQKIHSDRMLTFFGKPVPRNFTITSTDLRYWGASIFQDIWEQLRDVGAAMSSVANVLYEFVVGKFKIKHLAQMLSKGNEGSLRKRIEAINLYKSVINAVLLDADGGEDYIKDTTNLGGLPDTIDRFLIMLSAVSGIPVTRLFGTTPNGLSTDDESGARTYYDMIRRKQKEDVQRQTQYLVDLITMSKENNLSTESVTVTINKPFQMTEVEEAELENKKANTKKLEADVDNIYINLGVLSGEEVRNFRFPEGEMINEEG